jgi:hypothetical protein
MNSWLNSSRTGQAPPAVPKEGTVILSIILVICLEYVPKEVKDECLEFDDGAFLFCREEFPLDDLPKAQSITPSHNIRLYSFMPWELLGRLAHLRGFENIISIVSKIPWHSTSLVDDQENIFFFFFRDG